MRNVLMFIFILTFVKSYSQSEKTVYSIIEANAKKLAEKSGAYSVSIGIIKDGKIYTRHFGELDKGKGNRANDNTYFEIASVTKLFTGQMLSKAVLEGKINLDDDIRKYLKDDYRNLEYNGTPIKVRNILSYTTALPRSLPDEDDLRGKNWTGKSPFLIMEREAGYFKDQFLKDLKLVKLDTVPGFKYQYSNLSLELAGHILENIYGKEVETLFNENIFSKLGMKNTKFTLGKNETLANGYDGDHQLMPHFASNLWGSTGARTKSTLGDLMKFLKDELYSKDKVVQETHKNIENSKETWKGYLWDDYYISEFGKVGFKHGGSFGTQTWFTVYPELNIGICMIVNVSVDGGGFVLLDCASEIMEDLTSSSAKKEVYGYSVRGNKVVFSYTHPQNADAGLLNTVAVAGSFNGWNSVNKEYQMTKKEKNRFELEVPISKFEKGKTYSFKFVLNKVVWMNAPKRASNADGTPDRNLTLVL
ncbi:serine hydrolase [Chryseobacterium indologenes]|uniref:serine hydrolase n=1 Tax=Chryseobacterium indologenes TaxID=253 RepID=UPI000788C007|nr:serine hydrolase [Chryseobacterium indologenes]